jgi:hypothetical protein
VKAPTPEGLPAGGDRKLPWASVARLGMVYRPRSSGWALEPASSPGGAVQRAATAQ